MSRKVLDRARSALFVGAAAAVMMVCAAQAEAPAEFILTSPDIANGQKISDAQVFNSFGCKGQNISPALSWSNPPAGTKSFALMVHDPDAPTGSGWWHWIAYNIPADATSLPAGAGDPKKHLMPAAIVQARTDFGTPGYGGPCPPPGKPHHYYFRLYALKVQKLDVPADATAALIGYTVNATALGQAELLGLYGR
jgi:Raf kinase inhibitor-like YbhB/YbcL family protein